MTDKPIVPYTAAELLALPLHDMLKQRDAAGEHFRAHPDSYGAMASWEMWDDMLIETLARLKGTALHRQEPGETGRRLRERLRRAFA